jgi:hypothetical protein
VPSHTNQLHTNLNAEIKKLFLVVIACLGTILISISAQTPSPAPDASTGEEGTADENTDHTERCGCPSSPDGKFAFVTSDTEGDSFGDRLQIIDLIEKKSGQKLQRIDDATMPVLWSVLWAPDSNGFALKTKVVGHPRLQGIDVYFRSGETFQKVELPDGNIDREVVWAPDSKRFALNYMIDNRKIDYATVAFYQLRGDKWVALHSPADVGSELAQLVQLAKEQLPKSAHERRIWRSQPQGDILKVRQWADANTAIVYSYSDWDELRAGFLITLKFDKSGDWKIIKTHQMSKKELEEEQ